MFDGCSELLKREVAIHVASNGFLNHRMEKSREDGIRRFHISSRSVLEKSIEFPGMETPEKPSPVLSRLYDRIF